MTTNITDLSKFGFREYGLAGELLLALADNKFQSPEDSLSDGIQLEFNPNSGNVFLVDEDCNTAMLNDNKRLENWLMCANCGAENYRSNIELNEDGLCPLCWKC